MSSRTRSSRRRTWNETHRASVWVEVSTSDLLPEPSARTAHQGKRPLSFFVIGATGVVGRRVAAQLVLAGHEVAAVGRNPDKLSRLARLGARPVRIDLFDRAAVLRAVAGADVIVNLATAVPPGFKVFWPGAWRQMDRVRREISANLAFAAVARGGPLRVIQESSAAVYPDSGHAWVDESAPARPASHVRSVLAAERSVLGLNARGCVGVCLRFGFFYGEHDGPTLKLQDAVRRGWSPLFGAADGYCSWTSHDDAASAVLAALAVPGGVYNVVEDDPLPRRTLVEGLAVAMGARPPKFLPAWAARLAGPIGETLARSLRVSNRRFKEISGWSPKHRDALRGMEAILRGAT